MYTLERYDDTLEKISDAALRFLGFIEIKLPELKVRYARKVLEQQGHLVGDVVAGEQVKRLTDNQPMNLWVMEYINQKYDNITNDKERVTLQQKELTIIREIVSELEQLGIVTSSIDIGEWLGPPGGYGLTSFGRKFISIIRPPV